MGLKDHENELQFNFSRPYRIIWEALHQNDLSKKIPKSDRRKELDNLVKSETNLTQREMDLSASIQKVTEEIIIKLSKDIAKETGEKNLCLAGGVALNCVANGILLREKIFDNIWIQPAAGDAGAEQERLT